jgi:hypothetical protein
MAHLGRTFSLAAILAGVALWAIASPAQADPINNAFQIEFFQDGTLIRTVIDNNAVSGDTNPTTGVIAFTGTVGHFSLFLSVGTSNSSDVPNPQRVPPPAVLEIGTSLITNNDSAPHTLTIEMSSQDFNNPHSPPPLVITNTASGSVTSGTLTGSFNSFADASNTLFGTSFTTGPVNFSGSTGTSYSGNTSASGFNSGQLYSLTNIGTYTLSGGGRLTLTGGNTQANAVPEIDPSSMAGALTLLIGGTLALRNRTWRRKSS